MSAEATLGVLILITFLLGMVAEATAEGKWGILLKVYQGALGLGWIACLLVLAVLSPKLAGMFLAAIAGLSLVVVLVAMVFVGVKVFAGAVGRAVRLAVADYFWYFFGGSTSSTAKAQNAVRQRIAEINENFADFRGILQRGEKDIADAMAQMQTGLQAQTVEFARVEKDLEKARQEVEQYRNLANMTQEQAFLAGKQSGKRRDRVIGFLEGVAASLVAAGLWHLMTTGPGL